MLSQGDNTETQTQKKRGRPRKCESDHHLGNGIEDIRGNTGKDTAYISIDETVSPKTVDSLEFYKGNNKLTIRLSKKDNRMYRIQIFLNDESEIRPVTYTGANSAFAFWELLKGSLDKPTILKKEEL